MSKTTEISLRIATMFLFAIGMSFIPEIFPTFFGDEICTGSGDLTIANQGYPVHYEFCDYDYYHNKTIHWGYRHWLYLTMGISLFITQVISLIWDIS